MRESSRRHCQRVPNVRRVLAPAVMAGGALIFVPQALAANAPGAPPASCDQPYDTYRASQETLDKCGIKSFPLRTKSALPDGGTEYEYGVYGGSVRFSVPPSSFDASRASADDLARYGIPPEPPASDPDGQARWQKATANLRFVEPPPALHAIPLSAVQASSNWTGYIDLSGANTYTQASGGYIEPYDHGSTCSPNSAVFWSGLGGWGGSAVLAQDGTGINTSGLGQDQAWWEILPDYPTLIPVNLYATAGQEFKASVQWQGGSYLFGLYNYYTGQASSFTVSSANYDGTSAEYISERPHYPSGYSGLTNFGTTDWQWTGTNGQPVQNWFNDTINMYNGSTLLADTGTATTAAGGFTSAYKNCS